MKTILLSEPQSKAWNSLLSRLFGERGIVGFYSHALTNSHSSLTISYCAFCWANELAYSEILSEDI